MAILEELKNIENEDKAGFVYILTSKNSDCQEFLSLKGIRLALIAYWHEVSFRLKDNHKLSVYARHHNYKTVTKLHYSHNQNPKQLAILPLIHSLLTWHNPHKLVTGNKEIP